MEAAPVREEVQTSAPGLPGGQRLHGTALAGVLAGLMLSLLLAALDQTIVSTALPVIIGELHGFDRYTWVVTSYLLTSTTVIPIVGKLSDQFGRKWFLVTGIIIFLAGSALSGAAQTINQLILFRGLQGIGGGMLISLVFTLIADIFAPAERARWQGLFTGVFALASVIGPTLGGWITDNASWRWVFYVNLPVGAVALFVLITRLPSNISQRTTTERGMAAFRRIDFAGALTAAGGTVCLLLGLTWGGVTYPWDSPQVIGMLVGAAVLFVSFIVIERFFASEPILPLDLFKNQVFAAGALLSFTTGLALFAVIIYIPLFIQAVLGLSATDSGAAITPLTLALAISAVLVGQLIARIGRYQFLTIIGSVILAFGTFLLTRLTAASGLGELTRDMIVIGVGLGLLLPVLTLAVQNALPRNRLGVGTGAVTYLRALGQTIGAAVIGTVVANQFASELAKRLPASAKTLPSQVVTADSNQQALLNPSYRAMLTQQAVHAAVAKAVPPAVAAAVAKVPPGPHHAAVVAAVTAQVTAQVTHQVTTQVTNALNSIVQATRQSLAVGITSSFWVALIVCGVIFVLTLFLKDVPLAKSYAPAPAMSPAGRAPAVAAAPSGAPAGRMGMRAPARTTVPVPASPRVPTGLPAAVSAAPRLGTAGDGRTRERLALAGVMLAAIADEAQREDASPELLSGLAALADGRYPPDGRTEARGRAVARDLLEPLALTALRTAYGERSEPGGELAADLPPSAEGKPATVPPATTIAPEPRSPVLLGRDPTDAHPSPRAVPPVADVEVGGRRAITVALRPPMPVGARPRQPSVPHELIETPPPRLVPSDD
jgi:EmrB/QacA subfamily drug resistance transporter